MRAAADQVDAVEILEAVARPQVQHLRQRVRQVERRAAVDRDVVSQSGGVIIFSNTMRFSMSGTPARDSRSRIRRDSAAPSAQSMPAVALVADRHQHVQRGVAGRRQLPDR